MKIYVLCIVALTLTLFMIGFAWPFLFSAASTELVLIGWFTIAFYPVVLYKFVQHIMKLVKKGEIKNENS